MSFTLTGTKQLTARLKAVGNTRQHLGLIGLAGVQDSKALVHRRTANLARSIRLGTVTDDYVEVKAGGQGKVGYAAAEEFGIRGGKVIVPRKAKVLAWGGPRTLGGRLRKGGQATNFARRVVMRARAAHPFLRPGVISGFNRVAPKLIIDAWNKAD